MTNNAIGAHELGSGVEMVFLSVVVLITPYAAFLSGLVMSYVVSEPRRRRAIRNVVVVLALIHAAVIGLMAYFSWIEFSDSYVTPALNLPVSIVGGLVLWRIVRRDMTADAPRWTDE